MGGPPDDVGEIAKGEAGELGLVLRTFEKRLVSLQVEDEDRRIAPGDELGDERCEADRGLPTSRIPEDVGVLMEQVEMEVDRIIAVDASAEVEVFPLQGI